MADAGITLLIFIIYTYVTVIGVGGSSRVDSVSRRKFLTKNSMIN